MTSKPQSSRNPRRDDGPFRATQCLLMLHRLEATAIPATA